MHPRCRCVIVYREVEKPKSKPPVGRNYNSELAQAIGQNHYDAVHDLLDRTAHTKAAQVWIKYEDKIKVGDVALSGGKAYQNSRGIFLDLATAARGDELSTPYQILFHEGGHYIDSMLAGGLRNPFSSAYKNNALFKAIKADFKNILEEQRIKAQAELDAKLAAKDETWLWRNKYISSADAYRHKIPEKLKAKKAHILDTLVADWTSKYPNECERADLSDILSGYTNNTHNLSAGHGSTYWRRGGDIVKAEEAFTEFLSSAIANPKSYKILSEALPNAAKVFEEMLDELLS